MAAHDGATSRAGLDFDGPADRRDSVAHVDQAVAAAVAIDPDAVVDDLDQLLHAIREVGAGRSVIDPDVVDALIASRMRPRLDAHGLTPRELDVLAQMAQGRTNGAIAGELHLSESAVEKHINAIFMKLNLAGAPDVSSRVKAALLFLSEMENLPTPADRPPSDS